MTNKKTIRERIKFLEEEQKKEKEQKKEYNPYRIRNIQKLKEKLKELNGKEKNE